MEKPLILLKTNFYTLLFIATNICVVMHMICIIFYKHHIVCSTKITKYSSAKKLTHLRPRENETKQTCIFLYYGINVKANNMI